MAFRRRFSAQEKKAFTPGTAIEWQNGSHWHTGTIFAEPKQDDITGCWRVEIRHTGKRTATIDRGQRVDVLPGKVRLAS
jgi:hypothetical protein